MRDQMHFSLASEPFELLADASRVFTERATDSAALVNGLAQLVGTRLGDSTSVFLIGADGSTLELAALHDVDLKVAELLRGVIAAKPWRLGEGVAGLVAHLRQTIHIPVVERQQLLRSLGAEHRGLLERFSFHSLLGVAIRAQGKPIGVILAARHRTRRSYTSEDKRLLEALADRAGAAIELAAVVEAERSGHSETATLYRLVDASNRARSLEEVGDAALQAIACALEVDRAAVLLFDSDQVMRFTSWRGLSEGYRAAVDGHSPWAFGTPSPSPIFVADVEKDESLAAYLPLFRSEGIGALGFVPLLYESVLLGKFMVYCRAPRSFTEREIGVARSIADQLASAVGRRKALQERERLIEQLSHTVRLNELFAGVLAHDLRNPLSAIMSGAQMLVGAAETGAVRMPARRILATGERMARMIDQLLDFTRIRSGGGIPCLPVRVDLERVCAQLIDEFHDAKLGHHIGMEFAGDLVGFWDPDRLAQVISNLVGNAVEHGECGAPVLVRLDGCSPSEVRLRVANRGEIPAEVMPLLFDPFRGTRQRRERSRGLGLGLFITEQVVIAHGGKIEVTSSAGQTKVSVTLPRRATSAEPQA